MLRNVEAFEEWTTREDPPYSAYRLVARWIGGLALTPWQWPSSPNGELFEPGVSEYRSAVVPGTTYEVIYRNHFGDPDLTDLIAITQAREP